MAKGRRLSGGAYVYRQDDRVYDNARCYTKTKWSSEKNAQRALSNLKRANPGAFDSTVRPYRCSGCKRWHVGHGQ